MRTLIAWQGNDYLVKLGTKQIPGILKNIQYKIDVNTGEFIPAGQLKKNEIAVCDLDLQEPVVIDEFKKHKTLGELILIDRISNMTSACGVVEDAAVDVMATAKPLPMITGTLLYWYSASGAIFSTLRPRTCTKILSLKMTISKSPGY